LLPLVVTSEPERGIRSAKLSLGGRGGGAMVNMMIPESPLNPSTAMK
jgi:hypothetical protein